MAGHVLPSTAESLHNRVSRGTMLRLAGAWLCAALVCADDGRIKLINYLKYLVFNNGPLATTGCDRGAFVNTRGERPLPRL